jgi:hypothetical protein
MSADVVPFPVRFRGYDRDVVDQEMHELRAALDYAQAERDRAVARVLAVENDDRANSEASATVRWLIDTAEQDAQQIRAEAQQAAGECTRRAEALLTHRVELIEQAQHEADVCRAKAAEEARTIVHDTLDKANTLLHSLRESETSLREIFDSGVLNRRMPPPRQSAEETQPAFAPPPAGGYEQQVTQPTPAPRDVHDAPALHAMPSAAGDSTAPLAVWEVAAEQTAGTIEPRVPQQAPADDGQQWAPSNLPVDQRQP